MSVNSITILGRLGQDPELKYTGSGTPVCSLSIATDEGFTDSNNKKVEKTEWHKVIVWGKLGELCNQFLKQGKQVLLIGRNQTRSYINKENVKVYTTEIIAKEVKFLGSKEVTETEDKRVEDEAENRGW